MSFDSCPLFFLHRVNSVLSEPTCSEFTEHVVLFLTVLATPVHPANVFANRVRVIVQIISDKSSQLLKYPKLVLDSLPHQPDGAAVEPPVSGREDVRLGEADPGALVNTAQVLQLPGSVSGVGLGPGHHNVSARLVSRLQVKTN